MKEKKIDKKVTAADEASRKEDSVADSEEFCWKSAIHRARTHPRGNGLRVTKMKLITRYVIPTKLRKQQ